MPWKDRDCALLPAQLSLVTLETINMAGQRGEGGDGRSKKIYMMPGSRIDWQLRRPAKNGSKAPQGGQAPGLF